MRPKKNSYVSAVAGGQKKSHPGGRDCFFWVFWNKNNVLQFTLNRKHKGKTFYRLSCAARKRWMVIVYYVFPIFPLRCSVMQVLVWIAQKIKEEFECERKKWNSGFLTRPGEQKKSFTRPVRRKHSYFFFGLSRSKISSGPECACFRKAHGPVRPDVESYSRSRIQFTGPVLLP